MSQVTRRFLFLLSSTRRQGNSEQLARLAARSLPPDTSQQWLNLLDYTLPGFVDLRHDGVYPQPAGDALYLRDATLRATDLVLVAPLYWYALPVPAKHYLDYWSAWMRTPGTDFRAQMKGKPFWAIITSSGTPAEARPLEDMLRLTADYMDMPWGGLLLGNGSRPGDVLQDAVALEQASVFFKSVTGHS